MSNNHLIGDLPFENPLFSYKAISSSHFRMAQKMTAVNNEAIAYTSPSTAENQKDSEKVYAKDAIDAEMKMAILSESSSCSFDCKINFLSRIVKDQNIKRIVKELENADNALMK